MESNSEDICKIKSLLSEVVSLLKENNEPRWAKYLSAMHENLQTSNDKKEAVKPIMRCMLGGMGSLYDLALYRDGKPLVEENDHFYRLLNELYETCEKFSLS